MRCIGLSRAPPALFGGCLALLDLAVCDAQAHLRFAPVCGPDLEKSDLSRRSFNEGGSATPFFCPNFGQKNMKPVKASLHTAKPCFIIRRIASCTEGALHKPPCQTWHGVARRAKTAEAFAFANMKQLPSSFHYAAASHFISL